MSSVYSLSRTVLHELWLKQFDSYNGNLPKHSCPVQSVQKGCERLTWRDPWLDEDFARVPEQFLAALPTLEKTEHQAIERYLAALLFA